MAQIFPFLTDIPNLRPKPTEGELHLLNFLANALDDTYEIYFQPFINGDRPDIILMRRHSGVMIIEVKDWNLRNYKINEQKQWLIKQDRNNEFSVKSPIEQVLAYKQNFYELHIENLLEKNIKNSKTWAIVTCAVYFHCETQAKFKSFLTEQFTLDKNYLRFLDYLELWGYDSLTKIQLQQRLSKRYLNRQSNLFDDELYNSFKRYLQPPAHILEQGKLLTYNAEQQKLIVSKSGSQKISGVAGSGKSYVLAKRAVNALKRIEREGNLLSPSVLILTYNITLKNYIHDRLSEVRENFSWKEFYITNYHDFMTTELNNLCVKILISDDFDNWEEEARSKYFEENYYSNSNLFEVNKNKIIPYKAIFVDEIQDYQKPWVQILRNYFLASDGEYVVFGDEKQNVYERSMDLDKRPYTGISGGWNKLKKSYRIPLKIANLATQFQNHFFSNKYELELVEIAQQENLFQNPEIIEYIHLENTFIESLYQAIDSRAKQYSIHPNDICILSAKIETLRKIDFYVRSTQKIKTDKTFET